VHFFARVSLTFPNLKVLAAELAGHLRLRHRVASNHQTEFQLLTSRAVAARLFALGVLLTIRRARFALGCSFTIFIRLRALAACTEQHLLQLGQVQLDGLQLQLHFECRIGRLV